MSDVIKIKYSNQIAGSCISSNCEAYVSSTDKTGWLLVSHSDKGGEPLFALPKHLKVKIRGLENGRVQFTVLEGRLKDEKGSVIQKGGPHFNTINPHKKAAKLTLNLTTKKLSYNGKEIDAFTQEYAESNGGVLDPLPFGIWKIEIADSPHKLGEGYLEFTNFATTWFPIEKSGGTLDRYVHVGSLSHGCATVGINKIRAKDFNPNDNTLNWVRSHSAKFTTWTDLYEYLIKSRLDDKHVGTIEVIK